MTAALFGLLGVLVGGLLQVLKDVMVDRRASRRELLAAARLVYHDLDYLSRLSKAMHEGELRDGQRYGVAAIRDAYTSSWHTSKATLAPLIPEQIWYPIDHAFSFVEFMGPPPEVDSRLGQDLSHCRRSTGAVRDSPGVPSVAHPPTMEGPPRVLRYERAQDTRNAQA